MAGPLALMLLTEARRPARVSASGELITLGELDRNAWDAALVAEGHRLVRERLPHPRHSRQWLVSAILECERCHQIVERISPV